MKRRAGNNDLISTEKKIPRLKCYSILDLPNEIMITILLFIYDDVKTVLSNIPLVCSQLHTFSEESSTNVLYEMIIDRLLSWRKDQKGQNISSYKNFILSELRSLTDSSWRCDLSKDIEETVVTYAPLDRHIILKLCNNGNRMAIFKKEFPYNTGTYFWEVDITKIHDYDNYLIGVVFVNATDKIELTRHLGYAKGTFGLFCDGQSIYSNNTWRRYSKKKPVKGSVIGVWLDTKKMTISFIVDGEHQGIAFDITKFATETQYNDYINRENGCSLRPAFSMLWLDDIMTVRPCAGIERFELVQEILNSDHVT
jgi:hypothetical protein